MGGEGVKLSHPSRPLRPQETLSAYGLKKSFTQLPITASAHPCREPTVGFESYHFQHIFYGNKKKNQGRCITTTEKEPQHRSKGENHLLCALMLVIVFLKLHRSHPTVLALPMSQCPSASPHPILLLRAHS